MARPIKKSLDYFPKDVNFYDDDKIIDLLEEYGPLGLTIYDVVITLVYKNGYYLEIPVDKLAALTVRTIGNKWVKNKSLVVQVIHYCADIGLLCKDLLLQNVITSVGIQRRYSEVTVRNKVDKSKYWLLEKNNFNAALENAPSNTVSVTETTVFAAETPINAPIMQQSKVNEIKVNESKVKCEPQTAQNDDNHTYGRYVNLTESEYNALIADYGEHIIKTYIDKIDRYIESSGKKPYGNHNSTIREWLSKDGVTKKSEHSYDLDLWLKNAMNNVPKIGGE